MGSDHAPILNSLRPPPPHADKPRPCWQEIDWSSLTDKLKAWQIPPPPTAPSPNQLAQWFSSALSALTTSLEATAPRSRPSPRSKGWWTPLLTSLWKEFAKATRRPKKLQTLNPTLLRDNPSLVASKVSRRRKPATGPTSSQRPPRIPSGRPNN